MARGFGEFVIAAGLVADADADADADEECTGSPA